MNDIGRAFIAQSQYHLAKDFMPKIERSVAVLSDARIWSRANEQSNSIGNLLLHLSGNVRQWILCGLGGDKDRRDRDSEFAQRAAIPRAELVDRLKRTVDEAVVVLGRLNPDALLAKHQIQGLEVSALEAVLHVVEHFSMHTGQIILMAKIYAQVDLGFYDFSGSTPAPTWKRDP